MFKFGMDTGLLRYKNNGKVHLGETMMAALTKANGNASEAYERLAALIGVNNYVKYRYNDGRRLARPEGRVIRTPSTYKLPPSEQRNMHEACLAHARAAASEWRKQQREEKQEIPEPKPEPRITCKQDGCLSSPVAGTHWCYVHQPAPEPKEEPKSGWMGPEAYLKKHQEIRAECERRASYGEPVDEISMRPALAAKALYAVGAEWAGEYILDSMAKTWDEEIRKEVGIKEFDTSAVDCPEGYELPENCHPQMKMILWLVKAGQHSPDAAINTWVKGPKGTGKTYIAKQLAGLLKSHWGFTPMTAGASYTWLTGTYTIDGYKTRPFVEIYENGGVFLFDEADAGDANMVMVANAALAGDCFQNPVTGEMMYKHKDTVILAAGNTWGDGADANYRGRQAQDAAFLDRFVAGRLEVGYDNDLERRLFFA